MPGGPLVVGKHPNAIGQFTKSVVFSEVLPCQNISVAVVSLISGPRPNFYLKHRVITMKAKKIVHCRLGVALHLPPAAYIN